MIYLIFTICIIWFAIFFIDTIFKSCMFCPYIKALESGGITVKPFFIKLYITRFNRSLLKWGHWKTDVLRKWFNVGAVVTCIITVPCILLFLISPFQILFTGIKARDQPLLLEPVVPGYNLPISQLIYYLVAIFICSFIHEAGHAIAAVRERVSVEGCGIFIIGIIPIAFVSLRSEQVICSSYWQQLRIFCAGIWHNIMLASLGFLLIICNPILLSPCFSQQNGISVLSVSKESGATGPAGLLSGDVITAINDCQITNMEQWQACLEKATQELPSGYCTSRSSLLTEKNTDNFVSDISMNCCKDLTSHLCFKYFDVTVQAHAFACLRVRNLLDSAPEYCKDNSDCLSRSGGDICVAPQLESTADRLLSIERRKKDAVLFVGPPASLFASGSVSPYVSKYDFLSVSAIHEYETLLKYIISFSTVCAVLNVIPFPLLDGEWICFALVDWLLFPIFQKQSQRNYIKNGLKACGFIILIVNITLGVYKFIIV